MDPSVNCTLPVKRTRRAFLTPRVMRWTCRMTISGVKWNPINGKMGSVHPTKTASWSAARALLMPQVNPGSLYRCGRGT